MSPTIWGILNCNERQKESTSGGGEGERENGKFIWVKVSTEDHATNRGVGKWYKNGRRGCLRK